MSCQLDRVNSGQIHQGLELNFNVLSTGQGHLRTNTPRYCYEIPVIVITILVIEVVTTSVTSIVIMIIVVSSGDSNNNDEQK